MVTRWLKGLARPHVRWAPGRSVWGALAASMAGLAVAYTASATPLPEALAFDRFLANAGPICEHQASPLCVDAAWRFADRDNDRRLTLGELQQVRDDLGHWLKWKEQAIPQAQRRMVQLGLLLVDGVGLPYLLETYDADRDGTISRTELLTDVRLDARPLGQVLLDAQAVDWQALRQRLGPLAATLNGLGAQTQ